MEKLKISKIKKKIWIVIKLNKFYIYVYNVYKLCLFISD